MLRNPFCVTGCIIHFRVDTWCFTVFDVTWRTLTREVDIEVVGWKVNVGLLLLLAIDFVYSVHTVLSVLYCLIESDG